jgi:hypothetical protein
MSTVIIKTNESFKAEKEYIADVLFTEILGVSYQFQYYQLDHYTIHCGAHSVSLPNLFFEGAPQSLLDLRKYLVKHLKFHSLNVGSRNFNIPIFFLNGKLGYYSDQGVAFTVPLDLFGTVFFYLTLFEEACTAERDAYGRTSYSNLKLMSSAGNEWPIVNVIAEFLRSALGLSTEDKPHRSFKVHLSHDVDYPYYTCLSPALKLRQFARFLKRGQLGLLVKLAKANVGASREDPFDTFSWLMAVSEQFSTRSEFYFIARAKGSDPRYSLKDPKILKLIASILDRGHIVGLHGSFDSYRNPRGLREEVTLLKKTLESVKASFSGLCRQHFLRFDPLDSWIHQEFAGISVDSTIYFPENPNFRAGICQEFPVYSLLERRKLRVRERPLSIMEVSFLETEYEPGGYGSLVSKTRQIMERTKLFKGDFTLLWHNDRFLDRESKTVFQDIVRTSYGS